MTASSPAPRRRRAQPRANPRRRGRRLFAERGLDVSLDDIAAAAGVGVGTVYRRFPDKDALIDALFEDQDRPRRRAGRDALEIEDPWEGFTTFMRGMCRMQAEDRGLKDALLARDRGRERVAARASGSPHGR